MSNQYQRPIEEATVWQAADFPDPARYTYSLSSEMIAEVARAAARRMSAQKPAHEIRKDDFPLSKTAAVPQEIYADLEHGCGFALLRGWPVEEYGYEMNVAAFCGVTAHVGEIVVQNHEGQSVVDVKDEKIPYSHESRGYCSNKLLPFHTDGADMVGLLCLDHSALCTRPASKL